MKYPMWLIVAEDLVGQKVEFLLFKKREMMVKAVYSKGVFKYEMLSKKKE